MYAIAVGILSTDTSRVCKATEPTLYRIVDVDEAHLKYHLLRINALFSEPNVLSVYVGALVSVHLLVGEVLAALVRAFVLGWPGFDG